VKPDFSCQHEFHLYSTSKNFEGNHTNKVVRVHYRWADTI